MGSSRESSRWVWAETIVAAVCLPVGVAALVYGLLTSALIETVAGVALFGLAARSLRTDRRP